MNKFHDGTFKGGKGPTPGNTGVNHAKSNSDSTANWKTNIGPTGQKNNKVGFKPIKNAVKSAY